MENHSVLRENRQRSKMLASPLMFESEDEDAEAVDDSANSSNKENAEESVESVAKPSKEEKILKGFQTVLMGIPPPPAFTVPQLDCREILKLWRENQSFRLTLSPGKHENNRGLSKKLENEAKSSKWPDTLQLDYWDVYYNKNAASEELERLSIRYKERYVGAETSSCINALFAKSPVRTASARKRARHRAWGHSPGRRLSHLARRRKAFSSASLCSVAGNNNPDKKMIMVEIKKIGNRKIGNRKYGQKKKGSVKKTKPTPKKKSETQSSTFKRALFQSPDQGPMNAASKTPSTQCIQRSKRNLFADSSEKKNEFGKRERLVPKRVSPRKRVNRSLSFHESEQPSTPPRAAPLHAPATTTTLPQPPLALSAAHKQKMLWAATNALREEGMGMSHELFRPCMTVLFRSCQRLWLTRAEAGLDGGGSTSERMLALAKRFSSYTIREISSDPTSEHMALVYNNSLKMAETMFNQPSSGVTSTVTCDNPTSGSGVTSTVTCDNPTSGSGVRNGKSDGSKQKKNETENNISVSDVRSVIADEIHNGTLGDAVGSSVVTKVESITENKTNTPRRSKNTSKNVSGQVSNLEVGNSEINAITIITPSIVNLRDSPRNSSRLARKTRGDSKVKSSVCNALFPSEDNDQTCERVDNKVESSLTKQNPNKDCTVVSDIRKNGSSASPHIGKLQLDPLSKESNHSLRQTPLKSSVPIRESPKRSCTIKRTCESNGPSLVSNNTNSSPRTHCSIKSSSSKNYKNNTTSSIEVVEPNVNDKVQCKISSIPVGNNEGYLQTVESSPQNKQTPEKKVSFSTILSSRSCRVTLRRPSGHKAKNLFSPPGNRTQNESSNSLNSTNLILKKTASNVNFNITESLGRRRITRSVSTDSKVKNKPIHHLFSPPVTQRSGALNNKSSSKEVSKHSGSNCELNSSKAQKTSPNISRGEDLPSKERRVTRRTSSDLKTKNSHCPVSSGDKTFEEDSNKVLSNPKSDPVKIKDSVDSEPLKRCLRSAKSPKKKTASRRISWDAKSTGSINSTVSTSSSQNNTVENVDSLISSPEFVSPRTRLRKSKSNIKTKIVSSDVSASKTTPDKSVSSPEIVSPEIRLRKATLNKRTSVVSSDASPSKDTPDKSVFSEEYSADTENSSGTLTCGSEKSLSRRSNISSEERSNEDNETNKENLVDGRSASGCSDKNVENGRHTNHRHLSSVENTPTKQVVPEEPVSRMLQLYRLSTSGGDNMETEKLLPEIVCLEPPKLMPHWAANKYESEETGSPQESPPSLAPHWEQESCSGTSISLPESIMAHWQQLSARANEDSSDKVMYDFEDTSYEITFPSAIEDSRASSICAPFDFPLLVDDSKSGFNNVFRRSSTESSS